MLNGTLGEIISRLSADLPSQPRRQPGQMILEGRTFLYADLHSFYYEAVQIFGSHLYGFHPQSTSPLILDCGAHVGLASLYFATHFPSAEIHAFEADPTIAAMLKANCESFQLSRVQVHAAAVWTHCNGVTFASQGDDSGHVGEGSTHSLQTPSIRLRDLLTAQPIDLLKLDIEGAEFDVLPDCHGALQNVSALIMEVHVLRNQASLGALLSILERNGFRYVLSDLHEATWLPCVEMPPLHFVKTDQYIVSVFAWRSRKHPQ